MEEVNDSSRKHQRIIITGPESSGKSVLAKQLSQHYDAPLVTEYSRIYLNNSNGQYSYEDLLTIAKGQYEFQKNTEKNHQGIIISDTGMLVMKIWSLFKYNTVDPWIEEAINGFGDLYLLCKPDIEWVEDPLRENPEDRHKLFDLYKTELENMNAHYFVIQGKQRLNQSIVFIDSFL